MKFSNDTFKSLKNTYPLLFITMTLGYLWVILQILLHPYELKYTFRGGCLFYHITGIPCPSCGTTRSVVSLLHGDFFYAFWLNPLGYFAFLFLLIIPFWLLYDYVLKKRTLEIVYQKSLHLLTYKSIWIPLSVIILMNWLWNIIKFGHFHF